MEGPTACDNAIAMNEISAKRHQARAGDIATNTTTIQMLMTGLDQKADAVDLLRGTT